MRLKGDMRVRPPQKSRTIFKVSPILLWKNVVYLWYKSGKNGGTMALPQPSLFRTVPEKDYFHLFDRGTLNAEKVVKLLKYKKEDVSVAANVPISSVRYEPQKMPTELKERLTEWAVALNLVASFFKDQEKAILWFGIPNPLLGGISPKDMIRVGRFKKLLNFIQTALDENQR